ncbi:MAG: hypothetical protein HFG83_09900 [Dorea sp.]|nr:hypothetical protein [Dorea sp.]
MKINKNKQIILWILLLATVFRLFLSWKIPVAYFTEQAYDDQLMYNHAVYISDFKWLGRYSHTTLIKSISYPFFVAICHWLSLPYSIGLGLLNIISAYVFIKAVDKLIPSLKGKAVIYLLMIYSPAGFDYLIAQRTYQPAVVPYGAILVFSCVIAVFLRRNEDSFKKWAIGGAFCLPCFYYIRDDSLWILPFVCVALFVTIGCIIYKNRRITKEAVKRGLLVLLPLFSLAFVTLGLCTVNYFCYKEFVTSERTNSEFAEMMKRLYVIEDDAPLDVWCSNHAIRKAMDVSPTLKSIEKEMLNQQNSWSDGTGEDMRGDLPMWVVRSALNEAGYFVDARVMNDFCGQITKELDKAFEDGLLDGDDRIHLSCVQVQDEYIENGKYLKDFVKYLKGIATYQCSMPKICEESLSTGDVYSIRCWEALFHSFTVYPDVVHENGAIVKDPVSSSNYVIEKIVGAIFSVYQKVSPLVSIIAAVGFLFMTIFLFHNRNHLEMWLFVLGVLMSAILYIAAVDLFTSWFAKDMEPFIYMYLAGAYPLIQIAKYLSIYQSVLIIKEFHCPLKYIQGHPVMHALRAGGLRPTKYTQGHPVMHALRAGGLRPTKYRRENG